MTHHYGLFSEQYSPCEALVKQRYSTDEQSIPANLTF